MTREQLSRMQPVRGLEKAGQVSVQPRPETQHARTASQQSLPLSPSRFTVPPSPLEQEQLEALRRRERKQGFQQFQLPLKKHLFGASNRIPW